jgi:exosortase
LAVARGGASRQNRPVSGSEAPHRLQIAAKLNLALMAIFAAALVVQLWPEWTHDPDLSHGFLMPVVCLLLLHISRRPGPGDTLAPRTAMLLAAALGAAALAVLWVAGLFAATLDWTSPVVDFTLASSFALLGCAAVAAFADRRVALVGFTWTSVVAMGLWPLCAPFPPGTYTRLTQALQLWVSGSVMHTLGLLGVAAHQQGNIIELARGTVGVEEACSGVRSLISCVFAGLLFSAALTRRPWARFLVVALSAPLALVMNFIRSLLLTLLVNAGVRVEGAWHDATGYAILVVTAALLAWIAIALDRRGPSTRGDPGPSVAPGGATAGHAQGMLAAVLSVGAATLLFFVADTTSSAPAAAVVPDLLAMLPSSAAGWEVETTHDLYRFAGTLRTDHLAQRTYRRGTPHGTDQVTLYVAYWPPGQASVGLVGSHTPDACWPGAGWVSSAVADPRVALGVGGATLPEAQHRLFMGSGYPQEVWFWQLYDGRTVDIGDPKSVPALIRIALRYGFRKGGRQAFVRVSSNRPWGEISREPFMAKFFGQARVLGLY